MKDRQLYGQQFRELSELPAVRAYVDGWRASVCVAFLIDPMGRQILVGLGADETLDFFRLIQAIYGGEGRQVTAVEARRFYVLRRKADTARAQAWEEYLAQRLGLGPPGYRGRLMRGASHK